MFIGFGYVTQRREVRDTYFLCSFYVAHFAVETFLDDNLIKLIFVIILLVLEKSLFQL